MGLWAAASAMPQRESRKCPMVTRSLIRVSFFVAQLYSMSIGQHRQYCPSGTASTCTRRRSALGYSHVTQGHRETSTSVSQKIRGTSESGKIA
jgi:hypothetical protein